MPTQEGTGGLSRRVAPACAGEITHRNQAHRLPCWERVVDLWIHKSTSSKDYLNAVLLVSVVSVTLKWIEQ